MKKKKIFLILILLLILPVISISINNSCKTSNIFKITFDLGFNIIDSCFSKEILKKNIKKKVENQEFIFSNLRRLKHFIFKEEKISQLPSKEIIQLQKDKFEEYDSLAPPFISGIINKTNYITPSNISEDNIFEYSDWFRSYGGNWNTLYNANPDINKKNIDKLKLAWKYSSIKKKNINKKWKQNIEVNPIFINGKIIFVTADWKIVAVDVVSGKKLWEINTLSPTRRGLLVEFNKQKNLEYLYVPISGKVFKFNAKNGKKINNFGKKGYVDVFTLVPPVIYKDYLVVVNTSIEIFNKNNGQFIKKISLHPKNRNFKGGLAWTGLALDKNKGIVYAGTGNPRPATVGIARPGDNKNSSSMVAIDINKKKIVWTFQETVHDLWDYDVVGPPIIHNLKINNKIYEVIILLSKVGNAIILERNTGKPIFDINYKSAPKSNILGEITAPFQIDLKKPEKFSKIEFTLKDINKLSDSKQNEIKEVLKKSVYGWFEPPSFTKDLITYGIHGGAEWMGGSVDPINQDLYIPVNQTPWKIRPYLASTEIKSSFPKEMRKFHKLYMNKCSDCHGSRRNGQNIKNGEKQIKFIPSLVGLDIFSKKNKNINNLNYFNSKHKNLNLTQIELDNLNIFFKFWDKRLIENKDIRIVSDSSTWSYFLTKDGLPASNPPWGYIAKINLVTGNLIYKKPIGNIYSNGKEISVGTPNYGGLALNGGGIIFFTGTNDSNAYAIDSETGKTLWSYRMEAAGSAPPIIYNYNGKQYVSFVSTGGRFAFFKKKSSTIYTFAIE